MNKNTLGEIVEKDEKDFNTDFCPYCNHKILPDKLQPESGTHCFTRIYLCGTSIDFPLGTTKCYINRSEFCKLS